MSINLYRVTYIHPDREILFKDLSISLEQGDKAALIGDNGSGKSTLLKIISSEVMPSSGEIVCFSKSYLVPQHFGQYNNMTIAEALKVDKKIMALKSILSGDLSPYNYDTLDDQWNIEEIVHDALSKWNLGDYSIDRPLSTLSGGEKTRVFLAGIEIYKPMVILMDEPTNHLDIKHRQALYNMIETSPASILIVSHDRKLLNRINIIWELSAKGIDLYGGNYQLYKEVREAKISSLQQKLNESNKEIRKAEKVMRDSLERKNRLDSRGKKKLEKSGTPRIMINTIRSGAEKSGSKLKETHVKKISSISDQAKELRGELGPNKELKLDLRDSNKRYGKLLVEGSGVNFKYHEKQKEIFCPDISFKIFSGKRIRIEGDSGSGKSTLLKLILGEIEPLKGIIRRCYSDLLYLDQEYSILDNNLSVIEQANLFNTSNIEEHQVKTLLNRYIFPKDVWGKKIRDLSGGEKIKLLFCCLSIRNVEPDLFILDEPTNNLDISSLEVVTTALKAYKGALIIITHDESLAEELEITDIIEL